MFKVACIVLFNPDSVRLQENLAAVSKQVDKVICVDNGSDNLEEMQTLLSRYDYTEMLPLFENAGIAKALNVAVQRAKELGAQWVLTLDQDSVIVDNLIATYEAHLAPQYGMITSRYEDRNVEEYFAEGAEDENKETAVVDACITSATYLNIAAWQACDGFEEKLFIDYVDFDMCERIKKQGYQILRVNIVGFLHEVGESKEVRFLGRKEIVRNHSAFRKYYIVRNRMYFAKTHRSGTKRLREYVRLVKLLLLVILHEKGRAKKLKSMWQGVLDSRKM